MSSEPEETTSDEHQLDEFARDIDCARYPGEPDAHFAGRLVDLMQKLIDAAELRIIDLEHMQAIASTYCSRDDD
jgi:hypothetical protein